MTYTQNQPNHSSTQNYCECEFTIPIKLNVPITINTQVDINCLSTTRQKLPVVIEPNLILEPDVKAKAPECYSQNGCETRV